MTLYEYKLIDLIDVCSPLTLFAPGQDDRKRVEEGLCYFGRYGWRVVLALNGAFLFERPIRVTEEITTEAAQ